MEKFVEFLNNYKETLVSILCCVLTIVAMIIKKKPKTLDEFMACLDKVITNVPSYCFLVERTGDGEAKREEVISYCYEDMEKYVGRKLTENERAFIREHVLENLEMTLSAPTKKKEVSK